MPSLCTRATDLFLRRARRSGREGAALLPEGVRSWKPGVSGSAGLASVGFQRLSPESWACPFPSLSKRLGLWGAVGVLATAWHCGIEAGRVLGQPAGCCASFSWRLGVSQFLTRAKAKKKLSAAQRPPAFSALRGCSAAGGVPAGSAPLGFRAYSPVRSEKWHGSGQP